MADQPGKIGRYEIRSTLGQGAMGVVYRGWDTRLEMDVAIKVLLADPKDPATSEELARLVREVKISRQLKHPNIVSVYDVDDDPATGRTFIVMEFIQGVPLGSLHTKKILSFQETVELIGQVASALDYASQAGVVHRATVRATCNGACPAGFAPASCWRPQAARRRSPRAWGSGTPHPQECSPA